MDNINELSEKSIQFYFDKVRIRTKYPLSEVENRINPDECGKLCKEFSINHDYFMINIVKSHKKKGNLYLAHILDYKTKIELSVPKPELFNLLFKSDIQFAISYIEMAKDFIFETKKEAIQAFKELKSRISCCHKRYSTHNCFYDHEERTDNNPELKEKSDKDIDKFYHETIYFGKYPFEFVAYCRNSKISGLPALHTEWAIAGSSNIKTKTGINEIKDFIDFDIQNKFDELCNKYFRYGEINCIKFGLWILKICNVKSERYNFTGKSVKSLTKKEKLWTSYRARCFMKLLDINNTPEFKEYWNLRKKIINAKKHKRKKTENRIKNTNFLSFLMTDG